MPSIFNNVKGLHPRRNAFSSDTYRNDFTAPLGVNIPCYLQEVPAATRIKVSASALVRLQALISPVMDNIDYYTHFWKIPYRLLENDRFTQFFSGEIEAADYDALFCTPYELSESVQDYLNAQDTPLTLHNAGEEIYNAIFKNGGLLDFLGYDEGLFPDIAYDEQGKEWYVEEGGNSTTSLNWRGLIAYFMIHENWYMNENVPYFRDFVELCNTLVKEQDLPSLAALLTWSAYINIHNSTAYGSFLPHGWEKDYFTSALPNVQYGSPVTIGLAGTAPVTIPRQDVRLENEDGISMSLVEASELGVGDPSALTFESDTATIGHMIINDGSIPVFSLEGTIGKRLDGTPLTGTADLSEVGVITINELRFANALQVFKERQMRYGRRRLEFYKGFFDVSPEDLRLQVPKYLGGGRIPINIADIEQTSATSGSNALGHLAGKATAVAGGFAGFSTFCSEESVIIGISFAMPHITYANQLSRFKMKTNDIYDYFNPSFEHLGEQAIKNIEVFAGTNIPNGDFGYTPRYTEYRFHSNEMHGAFKDSLSYWSLGRIFSDTPALNRQFIYMQPWNFDRIFAVSGQPNMIVSMLFRVRTIKPVSKYGTPMLLA